jgi:hypothetical protein
VTEPEVLFGLGIGIGAVAVDLTGATTIGEPIGARATWLTTINPTSPVAGIWRVMTNSDVTHARHSFGPARSTVACGTAKSAWVMGHTIVTTIVVSHGPCFPCGAGLRRGLPCLHWRFLRRGIWRGWVPWRRSQADANAFAA